MGNWFNNKVKGYAVLKSGTEGYMKDSKGLIKVFKRKKVADEMVSLVERCNGRQSAKVVSVFEGGGGGCG